MKNTAIITMRLMLLSIISCALTPALQAEKKSFTLSNKEPKKAFYVTINGIEQRKVAPQQSYTIEIDPETALVAYEFILAQGQRDQYLITKEFLENNDGFTYPDDHDIASERQIKKKKVQDDQKQFEVLQKNEALKFA